MSIVSKNFRSHFEAFQNLTMIAEELKRCAMICVDTLKRGNKILICGNGGSAADAQHFATEITTKYFKVRSALPAISLSTDTSALTAIGNDFGFERIFSRQVEALGKKGDLLIVISTSGNSKNIIKAISAAKEKELEIINFGGCDGGAIAKICKNNLIVPAFKTARIQECHIFMIHCICEIIDEEF